MAQVLVVWVAGPHLAQITLLGSKEAPSTRYRTSKGSPTVSKSNSPLDSRRLVVVQLRGPCLVSCLRAQKALRTKIRRALSTPAQESDLDRAHYVNLHIPTRSAFVHWVQLLCKAQPVVLRAPIQTMLEEERRTRLQHSLQKSPPPLKDLHLQHQPIPSRTTLQ